MELRKVTMFVLHANNEKKLISVAHDLRSTIERLGFKLLMLNKGHGKVIGFLNGAITNDVLRINLRKAKFKSLETLIDSRVLSVSPFADKIAVYFSTDNYLLSELAYDLQVSFSDCCEEGMTIMGTDEKPMPLIKQLTESDAASELFALDVDGDLFIDGIFKLHEKPIPKLGNMLVESSADYMVSVDHRRIIEKYETRQITKIECQIS